MTRPARSAVRVELNSLAALVGKSPAEVRRALLENMDRVVAACVGRTRSRVTSDGELVEWSEPDWKTVLSAQIAAARLLEADQPDKLWAKSDKFLGLDSYFGATRVDPSPEEKHS